MELSGSTRQGAAAALALAARGWPVFPLAGKIPRTEHGFEDATTDAEQLRSWFTQWPDAGLGVATGPAGLLVVDVDPRHGGDESLHDLEREHGELPETVRVKTGGGGEHIYFANPNGLGCSAGKLGDGLDVKADGGYVVAPPSVHPSGRRYEYDIPPDEVEVADPPAWLLERLRSPRGRASGEPAPSGGEIIPQGRRDSTLLSLAGSMRRVGMTAREIGAALAVVNRERCRPPVDEAKVRELAERAGGYPAGAPKIATPEAAEAAQELGELLALPSVGVAVAGCRIVGTGREASGDIYLSDGRAITFNPLRLALAATSLMETVVSTVGAEPALKNPDARHAVALMRQIGKLEEVESEDSRATQYGRDFLEAADVLDVDMSDQAQRWAAFCHLRDRDPVARARAEWSSIAKASVVLRDTDGTLYVRTAWFKAHIKAAEDSTLSPAALATLMQRVGWSRRGKKGRIHARRPDLAGSDYQSFYIVPPDWDGIDVGPPVTLGAPLTGPTTGDPFTPGDPSNAHAHARAIDTHQGSPGHQGEDAAA